MRKKKGLEVEEIRDSKVSVNSLVILNKIDKYSPEKTEELADKVFNREITRNDLHSIYKAVRPSAETRERISSIYASKSDEEIRTEKIKENIKTSNILSTLYSTEYWLGKKKESTLNLLMNKINLNILQNFHCSQELQDIVEE